MGNKRQGTRTGGVPKNEGDLPTSSSSSPFPEAVPCSPGVETSKKKRASRIADSNESKPVSSRKDLTDHSRKQHNAHLSSHGHHQQHRQNLGRPIYLKRSRHYYGGHQQHHWKSPGTYFRPSSSHGKDSPWAGNLSFRIASPDYGHYTELRNRAYDTPQTIIESNSANTNSEFPDLEKIPCGICHKLLTWDSVVAVLVCGHLYHFRLFRAENASSGET